LRRGARQNRRVPHRVVVSALLVTALGAGGCKRHTDQGPGAPCDAVGAKFAMVARADLAADKSLADDVRAGVDGLIAPMRDGMVRACKDAAWAAPARDCFAAAGDERAMKACYAQLTADQRGALDRAAAGSGTDTGPATR
jgi:hypothetical protein